MAGFALVLAAACGFVITALSGWVLIPILHKLKYGQPIKEIGPTWHKKKQGTPTMGGLCFILGSTVGLLAALLLLAARLPDTMTPSGSTGVIMAVLSAYGFGLVGFLDDFIKITRKHNKGLGVWQKIVMQTVITIGFLWVLTTSGLLSTAMQLPFLGLVDFGWLFYPFSFLFIIFMVNAVNLTDGIDGLATSVTFVALLGLLFLTGILGFFQLSLFTSALAAACVGFLLWNFYPAKVFMGDTGSMFLGGAVVGIAYCMGRPEILLFVGFIYICEAASVVIQVTYFKLTHGKRIFKMTPIHHSFEMSGWSEVKIDTVFSLVEAVCVALGLLFVYYG